MFDWVFVVAILIRGELIGMSTNHFKTEQHCNVAQNGQVEASARLEHTKNAVQTAVGPCTSTKNDNT